MSESIYIYVYIIRKIRFSWYVGVEILRGCIGNVFIIYNLVPLTHSAPKIDVCGAKP